MPTPSTSPRPIHVYVTENADGTATRSYKTLSAALAPYAEDAPGLAAIAAEIDTAFATVARAATD